MAIVQLTHKRIGNDIQIAVQLLNNEVPLNWSEVSRIYPTLWSDSQRVRMGMCRIDGVDPQDPTVLWLFYSGKNPQYKGVARLVIEMSYMSRICTVDCPALVFVCATADEGEGPVDVEIHTNVDPEVNSLQIVIGGGGSASWGTITGNISNQTDLKNALDAKQDVISDLPSIRSGAEAGATAVQPGALATVATSGDYSDLSNKPTIPSAQVQSDWDEADTTKPAYIKNKPTIPSGVTVDQVYDATSANAQSGVAMAGALAGKEDTISDLSTIRSGAAAGATAVQPGALAAVATSGQYSDLSGKPTVPVITLNGSTAGTPSFYAPTSAGTAGQVLVSTGGAPTWQAAPSGGGDVTDVTLGGTSVVDGNGVAVLPAYPVVPTLATVATSGDYDDLLNKPTIPAAQVNSDWNAGSGAAQILNKPSLAAVATSGSYDDLTGKPTIPTVPTISTDIETDKASNSKTASPKAVADYVGNPLESISAPTPYDGTIIFTHRNGDTDTVDLNHSHPAYEEVANKVTSLSALSTNDQYPSAKCVYDIIGDVETLLAAL